MRAWSVALASVLILAAGCTAQEPPVDSNADDGDSGPDAARDDAMVPAESTVLLAPEVLPVVDPLTGITELHWASTEALPAFALEFRADFGKENRCEFLRGSASGAGAPGPRSISILESEWGAGWSVSSSGSFPGAVHAGPIDTRTETAGGGSSLSGSSGTFAGEMRLTFLARDVAPAESPFFLEPVSIAFSLTCDAPFSVFGVRGSSEAVLFDAQSMDGGAGAEAFLVGGANAGDQVVAQPTSSAVRAAADGFGLHAGRLVLGHPGGEGEWLLLPDYLVNLAGSDLRSIEGGPGTYTATLDRAGAYFEAFWGAVWGLEDGMDLTEGLRAESVLESPFG